MCSSALKAFIVSLVIAIECVADADVQSLQQECVELGFKINSEANSDCALKLLKRARKQDELARSQEAEISAREAQQRQIEYQQGLVRQQQLEMYELQQRSLAAQERAAKAQSDANANAMIFNGIQMMNGTGAYYKPPPPMPRAPINCYTTGNYTTCN